MDKNVKEKEQKAAEQVEVLGNLLESFNEDFPVEQYKRCPVCRPGLGEIYLRRVVRIGHKGDFPRAYDWENILPQLHENEELLWIVRKRGSQDNCNIEDQSGITNELSFEVYIGLKFVGGAPASAEEWGNRKRRFDVLTRGFARSAFPETILKKDMTEQDCSDFLKELATMHEALLVTGMPSIKDSELKEVSAKRDEKLRPWAGLNDIVEMHGGTGEDFAIVFSVSKAEPNRIVRDFNALFAIQNKIKPELEKTIQYTEGTSWAKTISDTRSDSEAKTDTIQGGEKEVRKQASLWDRIKRGCGNIKRWITGTDGEVELDNLKYKKQIGTSTQRTKSESNSESDMKGGSKSKAWSVKSVNAALMFADKRIEESLAQLTQTIGTGGYSCGAAIYASDYFVARSVADATRATLSGGQSALNPMRVYPFVHAKNQDWVRRQKPLSKVMEEEGLVGGVLNCEKACLYLPLPTTHLPGLPIKKNVFYGKSDASERASSDSVVQMGAMSFAEPHVLDENTLESRHNKFVLAASKDDLYSHLFVVGTTGCGKTTRAAKLIRDAEGIRRIILETAKKTYWNELGMDSNELLVYTLGDSTGRPLRFNPFFFEKGTNLKQHIAVLADAISDLLPMEALIGPKLREAVERCYRLCGWDIERSERSEEYAQSKLEYPNVAMFNLIVSQIADEMSDYSAEIKGNYKGALLNRAAIFMDDVYQDIFAFDGNKTVDELFPPDKTVIIEMEEMPPSEINMPAFIISLLLQRIRSYQNNKAREGEIESTPGFLIAVEEAHNVLSASIQEKRDETQSGKGAHLVKQVVRLLAEGRGLKMGLMVIDQSAANIAPAVITNTNTKLVFRQEDGKEIETIGKAIGLKEDEWNDLQLLERGEYLLRNSRFPRPIKMAPLSKFDLPDKSKCERRRFFDEHVQIPRYQQAEELLLRYCDGDGLLRKANDQPSLFLGYNTPMFKATEENLHKLAIGNEELELYMRLKTLLKKKYYKTANNELGI